MNNIEALIYCLSTLKSQDRDGESDRVFDGNGNKHWISIANGKVKLNNNCGYSEFRQDKYTTEVVPRLRFRILEAIGSNEVTFSEIQRGIWKDRQPTTNELIELLDSLEAMGSGLSSRVFNGRICYRINPQIT
jgi:hypothetical protein